MKLYHVTLRNRCRGIAEYGFRADTAEGMRGAGILLVDELWSPAPDGEYPVAVPKNRGGDAVVLAFDIPDGVADRYRVEDDPPTPDEPGDDPAASTGTARVGITHQKLLDRKVMPATGLVHSRRGDTSRPRRSAPAPLSRVGRLTG